MILKNFFKRSSKTHHKQFIKFEDNTHRINQLIFMNYQVINQGEAFLFLQKIKLWGFQIKILLFLNRSDEEEDQIHFLISTKS